MKKRSKKQLGSILGFLLIFTLACNFGLGVAPNAEVTPYPTSSAEAKPIVEEVPQVQQVPQEVVEHYTPLVQGHEVEPANGEFPGVIRETAPDDGHYMGAVGYQMNIRRCDEEGDNFERSECDLEVWKHYTNVMYPDSPNGLLWYETWTELQKFLQENTSFTEIRVLFNESIREDPMRPGEARVMVSDLHLLDAELPLSDGTMFFTWDIHPENPQDEELYLPWPALR